MSEPRPEPCSQGRLEAFLAAASDRSVCWPPTHRLPTQEELAWLVSEARDAQAMRAERDDLLRAWPKGPDGHLV